MYFSSSHNNYTLFFLDWWLSRKLYSFLLLQLLLQLLQVLNLSMEKIKLQTYSFVPLYSLNIITSLSCCSDVMLPGSWGPGKQLLSPLKVLKKVLFYVNRYKLYCVRAFFPPLQLTTYRRNKLFHFLCYQLFLFHLIMNFLFFQYLHGFNIHLLRAVSV